VFAIIRGNVAAFLLFSACFALHIIAGAADLGWLFAIAVGLIFVTATGFPAIAVAFAGGRRAVLFLAVPIGVMLTASALWAANGRSFAWWEVPLAAALVAVSSGVLFGLGRVGRKPSVPA
jgi:hypothetical protein